MKIVLAIVPDEAKSVSVNAFLDKGEHDKLISIEPIIANVGELDMAVEKIKEECSDENVLEGIFANLLDGDGK
ncbi:hypothetical protein [Atopobacter phocae]|uniref:hypothetical protein n=1 Tax=Atopobacter phocae TaxID=136492 RepID=UPI0004715382|nr:hypothetical protein [Atopobacter phocae]